MLVFGVLGFQCVFLALVLILFVVINNNWRNAAEKKEEIMRLVAKASEEAALAEIEATAEYTSMPAGPCYQCAVCFSPTALRCSQCKAVRYCSGKCQILHWRQGHKDECSTLIAPMQFQEENDFGGKAILEKQSDFGIEGESKFFSEASLMMGDDSIVRPYADIKQSHSGVASLDAILPTGFTPSRAGSKSFAGISSSEVVGPVTIDRSVKPLSEDVAHDKLGINTNINEMELNTLQPPESTNLVNSVDRVSCSSNLNKMKSSNFDEGVDFKSQFSKSKAIVTDDVKPTKLGNNKPTRGSTLTGKLVADASMFRQSPSLSCSRSDSVADDGEDDSELFECKEVKSLSFNSSSDIPSSTNGVHYLKPAKIGSIPSLPQNVCNGLKTSVRKVVQQFKTSKESKSNLLGLENEIAGNYNCKIVFPYELFSKLYCYDKVELCPFGLTNCGNSCYANAVLQCLAFTRPLTCYLLQGLHSKSCRKKGWCFICEFECLIQKARAGNSPLSPIGILSKIDKIGSHLGHGREEDAHEFLRYAVDTMQSVCLKEVGIVGPMAEETTLVGLTFGGYLRSKIKCMKCLGKSERCEQMMDLTVEIDGDIGTLEEALAQYTATEILDRDNKYFCSRCKSYEKAKKKLTILEVPNILTIVLKRFRSSNFEKLNKSIQFPEILNMAQYVSGRSDKSPLYSLYAVVVHLDISNAAGHYVCYVKNFQGKWFRIDDDRVEPVELERVLLEGAYMLLYARHSPRAPALARNHVVSNGGRLKKRNLEAVPSSLSTSKTKSNSVVPGLDPPTLKLGTKNQLFHPHDWRVLSMRRSLAVDSSSESSSLFSCSDASSCSTASTMDSSSTGDFSDYIFGEGGSSWYNHYGHSSDPIESSSYQNFDEDSDVEDDPWNRLPHKTNGWREDFDGEGRSAILYTDRTKHRRKSNSQFGSSSSFEQFVNPYDVNSGVLLRRASGERSTQTFY